MSHKVYYVVRIRLNQSEGSGIPVIPDNFPLEVNSDSDNLPKSLHVLSFYTKIMGD